MARKKVKTRRAAKPVERVIAHIIEADGRRRKVDPEIVTTDVSLKRLRPTGGTTVLHFDGHYKAEIVTEAR